MPSPKEEVLAKNLISSGVSVIWGTGPHVLQKIEISDKGIIAHSLGNFVFDKLNDEATKLALYSCMLEVIFTKNDIVSLKIFPILTESGYIRIPIEKELEVYIKNFFNLYILNEKDFYHNYGLWKRIKDRTRVAITDLRNNPVEGIKKNFKLRYLNRVIHVIWYKNKIIIIVIVFSILLFFGWRIFIRLK